MLAGCSTLTPANDPVALKLTDLEARVIRIERVVENQSLIELSTQLDQLQRETQSLRGEIETLRHDSEEAQARQRDLYVDVDQRLQGLEARTAGGGAIGAGPGSAALTAPGGPNGGAAVTGGGAAATTGTPGAPAAGVSDQQAYNAAFELIQARQYEQAASGFESFLANYPDSGLADNAQYWLAETHYVRRQFSEALPAFQKVIDSYPRSAKLPDALLKVGYCNYELKQFDAAREALQQVTRLYPDTTAARLAEQRLDRIAQEAG